MQGISAIIAIILVLIIVVAVASLLWMFMSGLFTTITTTASNATISTTTSMLSLMKIDSISMNTVYLRNVGQTDITGLSVYINDGLAHFNATDIIKTGEVKPIKIYDFIKGGENIKITSANAQSVSKIAPDPCDNSAAVLCINFDDGTAKDHSGYNNDGNIIEAISVPGKYGNALDFDGEDDYVEIGSGKPIPNGWNEETVEIVVKGKTYSSWKNYISFYGDNTMEHRLVEGGTNGDVRFRFNDGSTTSVNITNFEYEKWYHIVFIFRGNDKAYLYVNGILRDSETVGPNLVTDPTGNWYIGAKNSSSSFSNVTIDEVRIYNKAIY